MLQKVVVGLPLSAVKGVRTPRHGLHRIQIKALLLRCALLQNDIQLLAYGLPVRFAHGAELGQELAAHAVIKLVQQFLRRGIRHGGQPQFHRPALHLRVKYLRAGTAVIEHPFLQEGVLSIRFCEEKIMAVGVIRHEPAVLVHIGPAGQRDVGGLLGMILIIQVIGDKHSIGISPVPVLRHIFHPPVIKVGAGIVSVVFVVLIGFLHGGLGGGQHRLRHIGRSDYMIRCLAVLIGLVDQQRPIPVVEIAGEIGVGLGMLRRGPLRHGYKAGNCQAAVVEIPAGVIPVVHFRPDVLQKSLDVGFVIPAVPQEEELPGNAGGGAQLIFPVPVQVDELGVPLGMGQQTGDAVSVQIVVIRHFADLATLPRPAGEVVPVGDCEAAVPHQVFKEEQIGSLRVVADVHVVGEGEEHIRFPFRHAVPSGGFRLHHRRVDIAVGGAINPDGVFPAIGAVNDESSPPLVTVHGVAGQGRFLRLIGRQAAEGNGHPGLLIRIGKGGGHVAVQQQVGHEPVLPVPPIQQGDALVGLAAVIEILPVELDIIAPPLAAGEGDGAVIGVPVGVVVGVILRQVVKGVQIHLIGLGQRQTGVLQQESVHIRPGELVGGADLAAVLRQHPQLFQLLLTGRLPDSAAVIEQIVQVDLLGHVVQAGEELVVGIGPHHAVNIRVVIEKFRVEEGQLLPGEGTGHPQQVIRPAADLVGEDAEPAVRLRFHSDFRPDLFPGTGGVYQIHAALLRLVVKGHGIAAALSGIEADGAGGVGVSMEVVIGVVVRKVGEAAHIQRVGFCQRQIDPAHQNVIRLLCGELDEIHLRVIAVIAGVHQLLPFRGGNRLFR